MRTYSTKPVNGSWFSAPTEWVIYEDYVGEALGRIEDINGRGIFSTRLYGGPSLGYFVSFDAAVKRLKRELIKQEED